IDGFVRFSKREFDIVLEMLKLAKRVTIVLPFENASDALAPDELFHQGALTYEKLVQAAFELGVDIEPRVEMQELYRYQCSDLAHIEKNFEKITPQRQLVNGSFHVIEGANRRAEVQAIAREIRRLTTEEGVRYRDIGIMYRQPDMYDDLILTTFKQYNIPYFSNEKRPMLHHPLIELVRSALEAVQSNWSYEPIFRSLKTDLFYPLDGEVLRYREQIDQLENFVIAKGIVGAHRWRDERSWVYKRFRTLEKEESVQTDRERTIQALLLQARDTIQGPLERLEQLLREAKTGREKATALFTFVEELHVFEKMEQLYKHEIEEAEYQFASEHEQVWNGWLQILDQFVLMFGDEEVSLEEMIALLDEGYGSLQFSSIPPAYDEVTISTVDYARFGNKKIVFIIGVNDGVYPMRIDKEGLISDAERAFFEQIGVEIAPDSRSKLLQEQYIMYRALTSPTDALYVTYATADEEGKALLPSIYVQKLLKMFVPAEGIDSIVTRVYIDPAEELEVDAVWRYLYHPHPSLGYLTLQLKQSQVTGELSDVWVALEDYYERSDWQPVLHKVKRPLNRKNVAETLSEKNTKELYGSELYTSVSRIEQFYRCQFAHFSRYGLGLQERTEYKLETFAMGDLFHEALRTILTNGQKPAETYIECLEQARQTVDPLVEIFSYRILESSARYTYIKEKLIRIVARTLYALIEQSKSSKFKAVAHEKPFGIDDQKSTTEQEKSLPALELELSNNRKMYLRGQIDRIDTFEKDNEVLLRVVDYKSSNRDLDLNEVYHGLSLQLLTYLQVALENATDIVPDLKKDIFVVPAGMLYVHVHDPLLKLEEVVEEQVRELQRLEQYRMNGLVSDHPDVYTAMDDQLIVEAESKVIPVKLKKDGSVAAASKTVGHDVLPSISKFVLSKHKEAGEEIFTGKTSIDPFRMKTKTACDYCSYKSICQFDPSDGQQSYREIKPTKKDEVIQLIRKECGLHDTNETE
ncbi:MAG: helicase-exonuclease AddAB subunit AddB, partial [Lysinibacillus sp.]